MFAGGQTVDDQALFDTLWSFDFSNRTWNLWHGTDVPGSGLVRVANPNFSANNRIGRRRPVPWLYFDTLGYLHIISECSSEIDRTIGMTDWFLFDPSTGLMKLVSEDFVGSYDYEALTSRFWSARAGFGDSNNLLVFNFGGNLDAACMCL